MGFLSGTATIARWEVKRAFGTMGRNVIPVAVVLIVLLLVATGLTAQSGIHLQDRIYRVGVDSRTEAALIAPDTRFTVFVLDRPALQASQAAFDAIVVNGTVVPARTDRGRAAAKTLSRRYDQYRTSVYNRESDLFAAYPLWINLSYEKSELDFVATQSGQQAISPASGQAPPVPDQPVLPIDVPVAGVGMKGFA